MMMSMSDLSFFSLHAKLAMLAWELDAGLKQARQSAYVFCPYFMLSAVLTNALVSRAFGVDTLQTVRDSCRLLQEVSSNFLVFGNHSV